MSHPPHSSRNPRPTLPPIRDLFRDELSSNLNHPHGSPLNLARLRVTDDGDTIPSRYENTLRPNTQPIYRVPLGHSESPFHHNQHGPYTTSTPQSQSLGPEYRSTSSASLSNQPTYYRGLPSSYAPSQHPPHLGFPPSSPGDHTLPPMHDHSPHTRSAYPQPYPFDRTHHPHYSYGPESSTLTRHKSETIRSDTPPRPWNISTTVSSRSMAEDDERTPVAQYNTSTAVTSTAMPAPYGQLVSEDTSNAPAKYECHYCGKVFNRPSSLKIHLNSHTGEKPFVCPITSCGRSFSVLSNMRRHARVHSVVPAHETGIYDGPSSSNPHPKWHRRRDSIASSSSNNSRRSRSVSSNDVDNDER